MRMEFMGRMENVIGFVLLFCWVGILRWVGR